MRQHLGIPAKWVFLIRLKLSHFIFQAAPNQFYMLKRGFRPSLLDWRLMHVSPYFDAVKRVRPLTVEQPTQPKMNPRDLDTVIFLPPRGNFNPYSWAI